jgi:hypothetical protein
VNQTIEMICKEVSFHRGWTSKGGKKHPTYTTATFEDPASLVDEDDDGYTYATVDLTIRIPEGATIPTVGDKIKVEISD